MFLVGVLGMADAAEVVTEYCHLICGFYLHVARFSKVCVLDVAHIWFGCGWEVWQ